MAIGVAFLVFFLLGIWWSIVLLVSKNRDPQIVRDLKITAIVLSVSAVILATPFYFA